MKENKKPERRTYLQDRFEILIKRQKEGTATFNELTELDSIVNTDPNIREIIIREMEGFDETTGLPASEEVFYQQEKPRQTIWEKITSLFKEIFMINRCLHLFNKSATFCL
jgi:hypothetical protein